MQPNRKAGSHKLLFKLCLALVLLFIVLWVVIELPAEPYIKRKIEDSLNNKVTGYRFSIEKVNITVIGSAIDVQGISVISRKAGTNQDSLTCIVPSIRLEGIKVLKMILKKDVDIREVYISGCTLQGLIPFKKSSKSLVVPMNISVGSLSLNILVMEIGNTLDPRKLILNDGIITISHLEIERNDTLSPHILGEPEFRVQKFQFTSADSNYTLKAVNINCSEESSYLTADSFRLEPNYTEYEFTGKQRFETDCFQGDFKTIGFYGISVMKFINSGDLVCSHASIGEFNLRAFRDKRKEFRHKPRKTFQEDIYSFPGRLRLDTVEILDGNITYAEHAEDANEAGFVSFNRIRAIISGITNDSSGNTGILSLDGKALFMGKGGLSIRLDAPLFDKNHSFTVAGILGGMEIEEVNTILGNNANLYAKGNLDSMRFNFNATSRQAIGKLDMIYQDLDITVRDKSTGDTTGFKSKLMSWIADLKTPDSNPLPGKEQSVGKIEYERDPEKFLFNYVYKSILSGIQSTLSKKSKQKKNP